MGITFKKWELRLHVVGPSKSTSSTLHSFGGTSFFWSEDKELVRGP